MKGQNQNIGIVPEDPETQMSVAVVGRNGSNPKTDVAGSPMSSSYNSDNAPDTLTPTDDVLEFNRTAIKGTSVLAPETQTVSAPKTKTINCEHLRLKTKSHSLINKCYICKRHWRWWKLQKCIDCSKYVHSKCTSINVSKVDDLLEDGVPLSLPQRIPPVTPILHFNRINVLWMTIDSKIDTHLTFISKWIIITYEKVQTLKMIMAIEEKRQSLPPVFSLMCSAMSPPKIRTVKSYLHINVRRKAYNRRELQYYMRKVQRFTKDLTQITIQDLNRLKNYWIARDMLFNRFDMGILLDNESFSSVCPEVLAHHIADKCKRSGTVLDPFCGSGGNLIQLATMCQKMIGMDFDKRKIKLARNNATVYGCYNIELKVQDYFKCTGQRADIIFLSPPWARPKGVRTLSREVYKFSDMCAANGGGDAIIKIAKSIAPKVIIILPRTIDKDECVEIATKYNFKRITFEENFIASNYHHSTTMILSS